MISLKIFPIEVAVWKHTNDKGFDSFSTKFTKRVKKADPNTGEAVYSDSDFFSGDDLLKVAALAQEVHKRTSIEDRSP